MDPTLASLLLDLPQVSEPEVAKFTHQKYLELYTDKETNSGRRGERQIHDGETVVFFEDRFKHAFFTSAYKTSRTYNKDKFDKRRATRLCWIEAVLTGTIHGAEGWRIPSGRRDSSGRPIVDRLYILWDENYLIWLTYLSNIQKWRFSSAYVETRGRPHIRRLTRKGIRFWRNKISRD